MKRAPRGIFSTLTHPLPKPSPRYAKTAGMLRKLGWDARNNDYEFLDAYCDHLRVINRDYPEMSLRERRLLTLEGVMLHSLWKVRRLMRAA